MSSRVNKKKKEEWFLSLSEVNAWRNKVSTELRGTIVKDLSQHLASSNLYIGQNTFRSGLDQCFHQACYTDCQHFVEYILKNHGNKDLDLNQPVMFHPKRTYDKSNGSISPSTLAMHHKETFLHAAVLGESIHALKLLLSDNGVLLNSLNCCSKTPLMVAIEELKKTSVNMLLEHKADVSCRDSNGMTPLMYAVKYSSMVHIIPQLIKLGADVKAVDHHGNTPMHIAVSEGAVDAVRKLLLYDKSLYDISTAMISPIYLIDQCNLDFCHSSEMNDLTEVFLSLKLPAKCAANVHLLKASWHYITGVNTNCSSEFISCKHSLFKALKKAEDCLLFPEDLLREYGIERPIESMEDLKQMYEYSTSIDIALSKHCLMIREHLLGYGDESVVCSLFLTGKWLIDNPTRSLYESGLKLWLHGAEMLLYHIDEIGLPSSFHVLSKALNFVISTNFLVNISKNPNVTNKVPLVVVFGKDLCQKYMIRIVKALVECVCKCVQLTKSKHSHIISQKSFIAGVHLILEMFDSFFRVSKSYSLGMSIEEMMEHLVSKCPRVIFDSNGYPNTLVHILLQLQLINYTEPLLAMILKHDDGQWMVNGVGPLGLRPLHLTHQEGIITMLLSNGAHLDAVNSDKLSVQKDIKVRRPDLSPDLCAIPPLKCLSSQVIVNEGYPYMEMSFIPPRLKDFIMLHDHEAQDKIMKQELEFSGFDSSLF